MTLAKCKQLGFIIIIMMGFMNARSQTARLDYYSLTNHARYFVWKWNYRMANKLYDSAFAIEGVDPNFPDEYNYAILCAMSHRKEDAVKHLHRCFEKQVLPTLDVWDWTQDSTIRLKSDAFAFINYDEVLRTGFERRIRILLDSYQHSQARMLRDSAYYYWINDMWLCGDSRNHYVVKNEPRYFKWVDTSLHSYSEFQDMVVSLVKRNGTININNSGVEMFHGCVANLLNGRRLSVLPVLKKEWEEGILLPREWAYFMERLEDDLDSTDSIGFVLDNSECPPDQWPLLIEKRKRVGLSIYLNESDYMLNLDTHRHTFPWVGTLIR